MPLELIFSLAVICGGVIGVTVAGFFKRIPLGVRVSLATLAVGEFQRCVEF